MYRPNRALLLNFHRGKIHLFDLAEIPKWHVINYLENRRTIESRRDAVLSNAESETSVVGLTMYNLTFFVRVYLRLK